MSTGGEGHFHRFDPVSGWCSACNLRRDGRLIGRGGDVYRPGQDSNATDDSNLVKGATS